jgi:hypothetical protein
MMIRALTFAIFAIFALTACIKINGIRLTPRDPSHRRNAVLYPAGYQTLILPKSDRAGRVRVGGSCEPTLVESVSIVGKKNMRWISRGAPQSTPCNPDGTWDFGSQTAVNPTGCLRSAFCEAQFEVHFHGRYGHLSNPQSMPWQFNYFVE